MMRWHRLGNAVLHPWREIAVQRAKTSYREDHPACAVCGLERDILTRRQNDVHHMEPVHVAPHRACDATNLITLCRTHHFVVGHLKNWRDHNKQLMPSVFALRETFRRYVDNPVALARLYKDQAK